MDVTRSDPSTAVQVQGSPAAESKATTPLVEEAHNKSGDSTDSFKENQPENDRSNRSSSLLNDSVPSKQQPFVAPKENSLTGGQLLQPTCNDSALIHSSDDDESFADCPSSFNSPAVNKLLHLGRASGEVRQSFGLDGLTQNFGKFTFDSANTTLDVVRPESDPGPLLPEAAAEEEEQAAAEECVVVEEEQVQREDHKQPPEIEIPPEECQAVLPEAPSALHNNDSHHTEELDDIACDYDDVEMMSVVMENGIDEDYSNIPLPAEDEEESFPDPPPPHELEQVTPLETTITVAASESAVQDTDPHQQQQLQIANESYSMDVDVEEASPFKSQSEILPGSPGNPVEVVSAPTPPDVVVAQPAEEQEQFISIKKTKSMDASRTSGEFNNDFKMPILRRSLNNQPLIAVNPFDDAAAGVGDHKQEVFFSSKDFDFLQSKETATSLSTAIKDSVLLRFDPLINQPVVVESRTVAESQVTAPIPGLPSAARTRKDDSLSSLLLLKQNSVPEEGEEADAGTPAVASSSILEEDELANEQEEDSLLEVFGVVRSQQESGRESFSVEADAVRGQVKRNNCPISKLVDVTMSLVDVNNDSNLSVTGISISGGHGGGDREFSVTNNNNHSTNLSNINLEEDLEYSKLRMSVDGGQQQQQHHNQSNGEAKIRNERYDDMERKLKETEEKGEALQKRLTEKEKQIAKMGHIVEEYERSIAGLMKERAVTKEEYERRCSELETERNANYQHLSSLETTFSDLHVKYERCKQQMEALKRSEEALLTDKRQSAEQASMQEQRYDKLKTHAMQQMEIANIRLRDESSQANQEISRLRALLKKEEITRCSLQEQLNQKTREIEELMKIWDELKSDP